MALVKLPPGYVTYPTKAQRLFKDYILRSLTPREKRTGGIVFLDELRTPDLKHVIRSHVTLLDAPHIFPRATLMEARLGALSMSLCEDELEWCPLLPIPEIVGSVYAKTDGTNPEVLLLQGLWIFLVLESGSAGPYKHNDKLGSQSLLKSSWVSTLLEFYRCTLLGVKIIRSKIPGEDVYQSSMVHVAPLLIKPKEHVDVY